MYPGAARAMKEEYAFIAEKSVVDYFASHHCGMTTFTFTPFPPAEYAIAVEKRSRFVTYVLVNCDKV